MNIVIETIPHDQQRYPTVGDWFYRDEVTTPDEEGQHGFERHLVIRVSKMSDKRYEFLVALHELVEWKLAEWSGITQEQVDEFDIEFERKRDERLRAASDSVEKRLILMEEPGDQPGCPIRLQHAIASGIERIVAGLLGVEWEMYCNEIELL